MSRFFGTSDVKLVRGASLAPVASVADALAGKKYVLVYFSAHWCPPCRAFTPQLKTFYEKHSKDKSFEVVFVSLDKSPDAMSAYMESAHGNWLAMTYDCAKTVGQEWANRYGVQSIPSLLVFENVTREESGGSSGADKASEDGSRKLITKAGRDLLVLDADAERFPWLNGEAEVRAYKRGLVRNIVIVIIIGILITYALRGAM